MKYRYYESEKDTVEDIVNLQKSLSKLCTPFFIDAKYLPILEDAQKGEILAKCATIELFSSGKEAVKNYKIAVSYAKEVYGYSFGENGSAWYVVESQKNLAHLEYDFANYELALKHFIGAFSYQQKNLPVKKWNDSIFDWIEHLACKILDFNIISSENYFYEDLSELDN